MTKLKTFDEQFQDIASRILKDGWMQDASKVRAKYESDGASAPTKYLIGESMKFDGSKVPILFCKKTYQRTSIHEIIWIWILRTNKISELQKRGVKIWDNWVYTEGTYKDTIGPAYGFILDKNIRYYPTSKIKPEKLSKEYQLQMNVDTGEHFVMLDQVDYLIQELINNPSSRRLMVDIWDINELDNMYLEPCVFNTEWFVSEDNKLHLVLNARSQDFCVGTPFNVFQYYVLQCVIAQITDKEVGTMTYNMGNVHIYDRHFENAEIMISRDCTGLECTLEIDPSVKNLRDFDVDKYKLHGYKDRHYGPLEFEIAE